MQLLAKAVLWLHVTLYRLTNGRIGGRFIAGSPILLLTTTGRRTGKWTSPLRQDTSLERRMSAWKTDSQGTGASSPPSSNATRWS
jgi:hypothetical protein